MTVNAGKGLSYELMVPHTVTKKITFADDDLTVSLGWLPANSAVVGSGVSVYTAWNGDGNDTVDLGFRNSEDGYTADPDAFSETILALDAVGHIAGDVVSAANLFFKGPAEVTAELASAGSAPSAGEGYVYVTFVVFDNAEEL